MLRITGGEHRGRRLKVPAVQSTRPLVERARQAALDHMRELIPGAQVWDVYAGSGILGLETLSRGAKKVLAVERHARAVTQLKENVAQFGYTDQHEIWRIDARHFLAQCPPSPSIIFFDPPYAAFAGRGRPATWQLFQDLCECLQPGGCALVHTPKGILASYELDCLPGIERRDYGSASLYWWHAPTLNEVNE